VPLVPSLPRRAVSGAQWCRDLGRRWDLVRTCCLRKGMLYCALKESRVVKGLGVVS
jgi:hypothetical protein